MSSTTGLVLHERLPVEHRFLGLDRRTFPCAVVAAAVWLLWAAIIPGIDHATPWRDQVRAGDVFRVTRSATIVPPVGWGVQGGLRTTDQTQTGQVPPVQLSSAGVRIVVQVGPWTGSAADLLSSQETISSASAGVALTPVTQPATIATATGEVGVTQGVSTPTLDSVLTAFAIDGNGIVIAASGPAEQLAARSPEIRQMIDSLRNSPEGAR